MQDYSIDNQAEKIHASNTKEYFREVIRSYYGENYRATIVTLYSVVIYDLLHKLEVLRDSYNDAKAKTILDSIEKMQNNNPKSPEWETKLIELIKKDTKLLDTHEGMHIDNLQLIRHLCAHPVRNSNYELFSPNKETVRAYMRNMLEAVLTKRPLQYKNIFTEFVTDIASAKFRLLQDENALDRYISSKYLTNLALDSIRQTIKALWKMVFITENNDTNKNRDINLLALNLLINKYSDNILTMIQNESEYYGNVNIKFDYEIALLINNHHKIFDILRASEQDALISRINSSADLHAYAWFRSQTIEKHTDLLLSNDEYDFISLNFTTDYIDPKTLVYLESILRSFDSSKSNHFATRMYRKSRSYDTADARFSSIIRPNLKDFTKDDFVFLLESIEANSQLYDRRNAYRDNNSVKAEIEKKYAGQINYKQFPNFDRHSS